ncbi:hypothetical protein JCM19000A_04180 [Silvimonas sp. JCM 19000]
MLCGWHMIKALRRNPRFCQPGIAARVFVLFATMSVVVQFNHADNGQRAVAQYKIASQLGYPPPMCQILAGVAAVRGE